MKYELGVRERLRYKNIEWIMPSVDVIGVLERLGIERITKRGDEVQALCPDHEIFKGCCSSHPNWIVNVDTGMTYCRTEARSSNLLWTISRILECHPRKAMAFMTGLEGEVDISALRLAGVTSRLAKLRRGGEEKRKPVFGLDDIKRDMDKGFTSEAMYKFFIKPPGKTRTDILNDTVDHYKVFQRSWGYYSNRTIVPFELSGTLVGFCAIDLLGKRNWLIQHPLKEEDEYKKVLYPKHFKSGDYLFGYDDCERGADYIILTEGAREVMKLWQAGFTNSLAILGGNVTDEHVLLMSKLAPKSVVLMFDGDSAGYTFTDKAALKLEKLFQVKKCLLPNGRDPKDLSKDEMESLIKRLR